MEIAYGAKTLVTCKPEIHVGDSPRTIILGLLLLFAHSLHDVGDISVSGALEHLIAVHISYALVFS